MSAGIGSVIFIGMGHWTGLSSSAYALSPFSLPAFSTLTVADFGWAIALAFTAALVTIVIIEGARMSAHIVAQRAWLLLPAAALAVGGLAIAFSQITHQPADTVLFSGQDAFSSMIKQGPALALSTLAFLLLFKGVAWSISLGSFPGRPNLPGPVHRRGRRPAGRAPARVLRDPGRGRTDGRGNRVNPQTALVSNHHRPSADL